jgi:tRNA pseudouridine(38-40) synthase
VDCAGFCSGVAQVTVSYFGPSFGGWAWHPHERLTVEGALSSALSAAFPPTAKSGVPRVVVAGAGRTDKGVSACAQVRSGRAHLGPRLGCVQGSGDKLGVKP